MEAIVDQAAIFATMPACRTNQLLMLTVVDMVLADGDFRVLERSVLPQLYTAFPLCVRSITAAAAEVDMDIAAAAAALGLQGACAALARIAALVTLAVEIHPVRFGVTQEAATDAVSSALRHTWSATLGAELPALLHAARGAMAAARGGPEDVFHIYAVLPIVLAQPFASQSLWLDVVGSAKHLLQACVCTLARLCKSSQNDTTVNESCPGPEPALAIACLHTVLLSPYWAMANAAHEHLRSVIDAPTLALALAACIQQSQTEQQLKRAMRYVRSCHDVWFTDPAAAPSAARVRDALIEVLGEKYVARISVDVHGLMCVLRPRS